MNHRTTQRKDAKTQGRKPDLQKTLVAPLCLCAFAFMLLLVAACVPTQAQDNVSPTSTPYPTVEALAPTTYVVQRGTVQETLKFQGRWLPRDQTPLAFETSGLVRRVNVQRGDAVTAGQLLADLDITDLENQLESALLNLEGAQRALENSANGGVNSVIDAEVQLANARLALENLRASSPWTSTETARLGVETARRELDNAQRAYDDLRSRPDSPASSVDQAYNAVISAQERLRSAELSYASASQSFAAHMNSIKQQENAVIQAELALERAREGSGDADAVDAVRAAQLSVDQIRAEIARASLISPIDGVVLEITIQPGVQAEAYSTVITVGQPQPLEAIANLAFNDASRLSVERVGVCNVLNQPDTAVQCIVRRLPLTARDADQTTRVAATLPDVPAGQIIDIEMPLQVREDTLWLPPNAIRTFQNRTFVVLQTPDGQRRADVQIGLQTDERVEILSGVNEGDVVVGQ
jgi:multidrug efflux pump subunit AcrA (membrane-fusion protein)